MSEQILVAVCDTPATAGRPCSAVVAQQRVVR